MVVKNNHFLYLLFIGIACITVLQVYNKSSSSKTVFEQKEKCSKYTEQVNEKIKQSGRVFQNDTYTVSEIFYSPSMNSCLYAWIIHTSTEPKEIYSIDDLFGGDVHTGGFAKNAEAEYYNKIKELKK